MSENIDPTIVARMNNLPELINKPDQHQQQQENIFDLINHLGDVKNSDQKDQDSSHMSSTPTDSQSQLESQSSDVDLILNSIEPIQISAELETSQSSDASSAVLNAKSRIPTGIPRPRVHSSSVKVSAASI